MSDEWTMDAVEEAFVRAHELERRMPGGGRWPFAGDAPWHLMQRRLADGDYAGDGQDGVSDSRAPRPPLDAREVDEHARTVAWLQLVPDEIDRMLVWVATGRLAAGEGRPPWGAIRRWIGLMRTANGAKHRYRMALATVTCRLNGWPANRAKALAV